MQPGTGPNEHAFPTTSGSSAEIFQVMKTYFKNSVFTFLFLILLVSTSVFLTALTIYVLGYQTDILYHLAEARVHDELFSRLFLFWLLLPFYALLLLNKSVRNWFPTDRWFSILLVLFALGSACAMADPFYLISDEYNVIRYWTAGALCVAGIVSVASSMSGTHPLLVRLFGFSFGPLLIAAGVDELLQFHEYMSGQIDTLLSAGSNLSGQDLVTLGFAVFGAVAVVLVILILRLLPQAKQLIMDPKYQRAFTLFALAVFIFLAAMMMDTFDWHMQQFTNRFLNTVFGASIENEALRWYGERYVTYAVNSLEELLEYLAALLFLMTIGCVFSIRKLGFDQPAIPGT
jgi:hypothetical protein